MNSHWTALNTTEFSYQIWSCPIFLLKPKRADWLMCFRLLRWIFMSLFWLVCRNLMGSYEFVLWWCGSKRKRLRPIGHGRSSRQWANLLILTGGNWQKWKRVFLTCPCREIYRDEAVGLKSCKNTWKITIFVKMWNLEQYRENLIFCQ